MRVEQEVNGFIIVRGQDRREQVFCYLVDHDKSSWVGAQRAWNSQRFKTRKAAERMIDELRRRKRLRSAEMAHFLHVDEQQKRK